MRNDPPGLLLLARRSRMTDTPDVRATRITAESLRAAGVERDELGELARQARGGASGEHGYGYEDDFAVARMAAACLAWFERGEDWLLTPGHPHCWVDDLVVERPDREDYAQLKTSPEETWGKEGGRLVVQFRRQAELCRRRGVENFALEIVTPHEDRRRHFATAMPDDLRGVARPVLFADGSLGWGRDSPIAHELAELCADEPEPSAREQILRAIHGTYHRLRRHGEGLSSSRFTAAIAEDERVPLRSDAAIADPRLWSSVTTALAASLPELRLQLRRGFVIYHYSDDERGIVARADSPRATRFLTRLSVRPPTTIDEFHQELP